MVMFLCGTTLQRSGISKNMKLPFVSGYNVKVVSLLNKNPNWISGFNKLGTALLFGVLIINNVVFNGWNSNLVLFILIISILVFIKGYSTFKNLRDEIET